MCNFYFCFLYYYFLFLLVPHLSSTLSSRSGPLCDRTYSIQPLNLWQAPPPDTQNGEIRYYIIAIIEVDTGTQSSYNTSNNSKYFTLQSLHPYYLYHISVAAATVGLGPYSSDKAIRMPEAGLFGVMRGEFCWTRCMDIVIICGGYIE